ncbi:MAG: radical SAM protein [Candidatus Heimdallarchaeota archaeon]|nr:radical SAM protein [Candidatus Heimdallarchaeota archaeon]MCK4876452.1 radical SAM protein [Candidatus Heimdallarchaeota archaeon]
MKRIAKWHGNKITAEPSEGCKLCALGAKLVLFITGECDSNCFYCPVAKERRKDIIFANEQEIKSPSEVIKEAKMISAKGAGITGGDPAITMNRVIEYLSALKQEFGQNFHCHLYTSHSLTKTQLDELFNVGLDEIRFHPPRLNLTNNMKKSIEESRKLKWITGIEIPVIPDKEQPISEIIDFAIDNKLHFINLNEFEITEANFEILSKMNYESKGAVSAAVKGSEELAYKLLKHFKTYPIAIHYCSSKYKDKVQLRNRLIRRAKNYSKPFDTILNDGLIARARIKTVSEQDLLKLKRVLIEDFKIDNNLIEIDAENCYLFTSWQIISKLMNDFLKSLKEEIVNIEIIHQYPYDGGIITYLEPLFEKK